MEDSAQVGPIPPPIEPMPIAPETVPPVKSSGLVKKILLGVFLVALMGLGGAAGFYFGTKQITQNNGDNTPNQTKDATQSASLYGPQYPLPTPTPCLPGFTFYENDYFSLCYPQSMDFQENVLNTDTEVGIEVVFSDDIEVLRVQSNFVGNLDKSNCVSNKVVRVSGFQATRNTIKSQSESSKCEKTILKYVTLISMGQGESVYYLGLSKQEGTYIPESLKFNFIEQSFKIKQ